MHQWLGLGQAKARSFSYVPHMSTGASHTVFPCGQQGARFEVNQLGLDAGAQGTDSVGDTAG